PNIWITGPCGWTCRFWPRRSAPWCGTAMPISRKEFLGLGFDPLAADDVVSRLAEVTGAEPYSYVVTPNVDHIVRLHEDENAAARRAAAEFIAHSGARFTFIGVGSPQQEMIAAEAKSISGAAGTALCIVAGLDFLTGRQKRAPRLARSLGLEWAHRLLSDPR